MNQAIPLITALLLSFAVGFGVFAVVRHVRKKRGKRMRLPFYILLSLGLSLLLGAASTLVYMEIHYSADNTALAVLSQTTGKTKVKAIDGGWLFDGPGNETALVFYPGAKVDAEAYAPLLQKISDGGVDCFLMNMPFRMALFNINAADSVLRQFDYTHWVLGGHSMGGVAASSYAANHADKVEGLLLLASYPNTDIPDSVTVLSVYGSRDGVLNQSAYQSGKAHLPSNAAELVIQGGNHAGFGSYGAQDGDNPADITPENQQRQTAEAALEKFKMEN